MNVLFVAMPFGAVRPAIGPSLLKARLAEIGVGSRVLYLNMRFVRELGGSDYEEIAERMPTQSLAGDWVFAPSLFGPRPAADAAWREAFAERFSRYLPTGPALEVLDRARSRADAFLEQCLNEVDWGAHDVVGFTSTFFQHVASLALARRIRTRHPDVTIAFGGGNCEDEMGLALHGSFPFVDYVCSGEADLSFPRLLEALRTGGDAGQIPGVISRREGRSHYASLTPERVRDLDTLPYPEYDDYFAQRAAIWPADHQVPGVLMETSRGCWWGQKHHCTFCGLNGTAMAFRSKTAARVLTELDALTSRYQPSHIAMVDNILDLSYFRDLLPELGRRQLPLELFYETKANLSKEQIRMLRDARVATVQPGIESLSTDVLRIMRKGTSTIQNIQLLKWCRELEVRPYWNFIYGFPGEDPGAYAAMAELIPALGHLEPPVSVGPIRLDRFSPNYVSAAELGLANVRPDRSYGYVYALPVAVLERLAYYFEFDYSDGRDPETYSGEAQAALADWRERGSGQRLVCVDHGETLGIWDFRAGASQTLTVLSGAERALYLYCDQHRSRQRIDAVASEWGASASEVEATLSRLVALRLMVAVDDRYLSLAVLQTPTAATRTEYPRRPEYAVF